MAVSESYPTYILDQLSEISEVKTKKMFGGVGIFYQDMMFAKIGNDVFRLKVDEHNQQDYIDKGMQPFYSESKKKGMPYWEVPVDVLENKELLSQWANKSIEAAQRAKK